MKTKRQLLEDNHREWIEWHAGNSKKTSVQLRAEYDQIRAMPDDPAPSPAPTMGSGINGAITTLSNLTGMMHAKANGECNETLDITQIRILFGSIDHLAKAIAHEISKTSWMIEQKHKILLGENYDDND